MNLLPRTTPKTFSLLSIGQRGVGKTVFLAGSYAELHSDSQLDHPQSLWFDCQDSEVQENIEGILSFVARTRLYPPPTIKITNFNFSLKRHSLWGAKTLCYFRWCDIPGESCNLRNPDFQKMVIASHGCCVFINADALVNDEVYPQALEDTVKQVVAIASLVYQHGLKYTFALILTKCDLLEPGPLSLLQIEKNLQPLITRLDAVKANYQRFYSAIPIVSMEGASNLKARGAAAPLLWLVSELSLTHNFQASPDLASGVTQNLFVGQILPLTARRYISVLALVSILLGVIASLFFAFSLFTLGPEQVPAKEQSHRPDQQSGAAQ